MLKDKKIYIIVSLISLLCFLLLSPFTFAQSPSAPKKILILHSDEEFIPANIDINKYLVETLKAKSKTPLTLYSEYLDTNRYPSEVEYNQYKNRLVDRTLVTRPDVIIAIDYKAYLFATQNLEQLIQKTPVVFCMIPKSTLEGKVPPKTVTGSFMNVDINGTLSMIQDIQKNVKTVEIIVGSGPSDQSKLIEIQTLLKGQTYPFDIRFVENKSMAEYEAYVKDRPSDTVLVYLSIFQDRLGTKFIPREALKKLDAVTSVPIYGLFYSNMQSGLLGGSLFEFKQVALDTADRILAILDGAAPASLPVAYVQNKHYMNFDYFKRWSIQISELPKDVEIVNRVYTPWELYYREILFAIAIILILLSLTIALSIQLRLKRRAESALINLNDHLESLVDERTQDLLQKNIELNNTQQQLINSEKQILLQGLTRNLLHKINTPLGVSITYVDLAINLLAPNTDLEQYDDLMGSGGVMPHLMRNQQKIKSIMESLERTLHIEKDPTLSKVNLAELFEKIMLENSSIIGPLDQHLILCYPKDTIYLYVNNFKYAIQCLIDFSILVRDEVNRQQRPDLSIFYDENALSIFYHDEAFKVITNEQNIFDPYAALPFKNDVTGLELTIFYNIVTIGMGGQVTYTTFMDHDGLEQPCIKATIPIV